MIEGEKDMMNILIEHRHDQELTHDFHD